MKPWLLLSALTLACGAAPPRPRVLTDVDGARTSPAALDAEQRAPQAFAHAEDLRRRAEAAQKDDPALAQILGEQALAAYERAVVQARLVRAEAQRAETDVRVAKAATELQALELQEHQVRAETDDIELRTRVLLDAAPLPQTTAGTPEREQARLDAARALALQARLLCASARLLEPGRPTLAPLLADLDALSTRFVQKKRPAPIDDATRLRSLCLAELSQVRRPKTQAEPAHGSADTLLSELSNAGYAPSRDDRGVVVTLRGAFGKGPELSSVASTTLQALGHVATAHAEFPILVVLHNAESAGGGEVKRLEALTSTLKAAGATHLAAEFAGDAAPLVDPARPAAKERNERVEVVFVGPTSS
jgi:hypothetical protein